MENIRCYLWKGVHATRPKNWGIYKSFNVSSMRIYKMCVHKCGGWSWWHKTWWKFKWSNFGMGSWTRNLAIGCGMWCYFSSHNSLWQVCSSYQNVSTSKYGGKTSGCIWFNKENLKNASTPTTQQPCGPPNKATSQKITKGPSWSSIYAVPHHILLNKGERTSIRNVVGLIKRKIALIFFKSSPPTLTPTKLVFIIRFMVRCEPLFHITSKVET